MSHWVRLLLAVVLPAAAVAPRGAGRTPHPVGPQVAAVQRPRVTLGIDVLLADSVGLIAGKRVGLLTNQAGADARGVPTMDRLARDSRVRLVSLFAPEHGIRGTARPGESVSDTTRGSADTVDLATGLPIYSLYGPRRAPAPSQLDSLDVLLVDLQDVGSRTFTFVSTTVLAMRAAQAAGKRIVVLDHPNPIGCTMQGPVLDTAYSSFIGMLPVPLRHGMTLGELARFANAELHIGADLVVVPVAGWHCQSFEETGLVWVRPSPNLPSLASVAWYPGTVLFEATNLSVGRGTDAPFRQIGAPWLDAKDLVTVLRGAGLRARAAEFTPERPGDGKYDGVPVRGITLPSIGPNDDPVAMALLVLEAIAARQPDSLRVDSLGLARRLGIPWTAGRTGLCGPADCEGWRSLEWPVEIRRFRQRAARYMLYPRR